MNDPRVAAVVVALESVVGNHLYQLPYNPARYFGDGARYILTAADQADREQGIHRVKVDYSTVLQLDTILRRPRTNDEMLHEYHERRMNEVLAALTGSES